MGPGLTDNDGHAGGGEAARARSLFPDSASAQARTHHLNAAHPTEARPAEGELEADQDILASILGYIPCCVFWKDSESVYLGCNENFARLAGVNSPEEVVGKTDLDLAFSRQDAQRYRAHDRQVMETGTPLLDNEETLRGPNGDTRTVLTSKVPLRNAAGDVMGVLGILRDVSDHKLANEALRDSEEKYRHLFEHLTDAAFLADAETGIIIETNRQAEKLLGRSREEIVGMHQSALRPRDKADEHRWMFADHVARGRPTYAEAEVLKKDGAIVPVRINATTIVIGQRRLVLGLFRDITDRKRAQDELRRSRDYLDRILSSMCECVMVIDRDFVIKDANRGFAEEYGLPREEIIGQPCHKITHQADAPCSAAGHRCPLVEVLKTGKPVRAEHVHRVPDGREIIIEFSAFPLLDEDGDVELVVEISQDVTARRRADDALRESKELLEKTFASQRDAIFILDAKKPPAILDCNPAATEILGYTRQEILGRTTAFLHVDEATLRKFQEQLYAAIAERGFLHLADFEMRRKDGAVVPTEHTVVPLEDEQGKRIGWVSVVRDITERKRAETELLEYQKRLQHLAWELASAEEHERRRVAADLHDQVGQSLAALNMNLQALRKASLSEDQACALDKSLGLLKQMSRDIRVLTFELCPPMLYETGLAPALAWLVEQFQQKHAAVFEFEDDGQARPRGDELRGLVFRGVRELLINAAKHAHAHHVKVSMETTDGHLRVTVKDDGIGFDASKIGSSGQEDVGLGLFSIRERLSHLGGDLHVQSQRGRGSCLTMTVPFVADNAQERAKTTAPAQ